MSTVYVVTLDGKRILSLADEFVIVQQTLRGRQLYTFKTSLDAKLHGMSRGVGTPSTRKGQTYIQRG